MSDISELKARIDGAITAVKNEAKQQQQERLHEHLDRQKLLQQYETAQAKVVEIAKPRLEALAAKAGERVSVTPSIAQNRRAVRFDFKTSQAFIKLTCSVAPDRSVKNVVVDFDLHIVPVLWKFDSHAEFTTSIANFDAVGFTQWLDDRIVGFVELFIKIHETEILDKAEYVEDPVAKVTFPKFAAGASLEHGGQTYFFIDETTKQEFAKQKGIAST